MTTVHTCMIDPKNDHEHPNESGCNDTMQCLGCGGRMQRELIPEPFENDAQVYLVWWSGYRCCACGKVLQLERKDVGILKPSPYRSRGTVYHESDTSESRYQSIRNDRKGSHGTTRKIA